MIYPTLSVSSKPSDLHPFGSILMDGAWELFGADTLQQVLAELSAPNANHQPLSFEQAGLFSALLEKQYGPAGGRGLAVRVGHFLFKYFLKQYGGVSGLTAVEFRLLPAPRRIASGLDALSRLFADRLNDRIVLKDDGSVWLWRSERCILCTDRKTDDPCCYLMTGMLQEFMSWAGGGRYYRVNEIECKASGDSCCTYRLEQRPID